MSQTGALDRATLRTWLPAADWLPGTASAGLDRRVELARTPKGVVAVRATVAPTGPYLLFDAEAWRSFLAP